MDTSVSPSWENLHAQHSLTGDFSADTWTAYVNSSNNALIEALDWVGVDAYPYFETTNPNSIENSPDLFFNAYDATVGAAMGKPVWVTETGWPVTGGQSGQATSGTANAELYWKGVACRLLGSVNTWWYQLNDGAPQDVSFAVIPADRGEPLYDLSCSASGSSSSSAAMSATSMASSGSTSAASVTASGSMLLAPTGTPSGRPMSVSGGAGAIATATPDTDTPSDNNQNVGPIASQPAGSGAPMGTGMGGAGYPAPMGTGVSAGSPAASNGTMPGSYSPSAGPSMPASYTGSAIANAPAVGLLIVGAIMAAL